MQDQARLQLIELTLGDVRIYDGFTDELADLITIEEARGKPWPRSGALRHADGLEAVGCQSKWDPGPFWRIGANQVSTDLIKLVAGFSSRH